MSPIKIIFFFIVAMLLRIAPIPVTLYPFNPDWILLLIIGLCLNMPERFGIGSAWLAGLVTDVLTLKLLGQFALAYALSAYFVMVFYRRVRHFPLLQQCAFVFLVLLSSRLVIYITSNIKGIPRADWDYWMPAIVGAAVWPLIGYLIKPSR
ncbi:MAG: rod shape-determining protein MreD [Gammaproteobacteria bacterium]|nr:rod shape-determining protein MreD [Gammaproteobacteria bacterium]